MSAADKRTLDRELYDGGKPCSLRLHIFQSGMFALGY